MLGTPDTEKSRMDGRSEASRATDSSEKRKGLSPQRQRKTFQMISRVLLSIGAFAFLKNAGEKLINNPQGAALKVEQVLESISDQLDDNLVSQRELHPTVDFSYYGSEQFNALLVANDTHIIDVLSDLLFRDNGYYPDFNMRASERKEQMLAQIEAEMQARDQVFVVVDTLRAALTDFLEKAQPDRGEKSSPLVLQAVQLRGELDQFKAWKNNNFALESLYSTLVSDTSFGYDSAGYRAAVEFVRSAGTNQYAYEPTEGFNFVGGVGSDLDIEFKITQEMFEMYNALIAQHQKADAAGQLLIAVALGALAIKLQEALAKFQQTFTLINTQLIRKKARTVASDSRIVAKQLHTIPVNIEQQQESKPVSLSQRLWAAAKRLGSRDSTRSNLKDGAHSSFSDQTESQAEEAMHKS